MSTEGIKQGSEAQSERRVVPFTEDFDKRYLDDPISPLAYGAAAFEEALKCKLHKHVVGQDHAVNAVVKTIQKFRYVFPEPNRPMASFMFIGPTGVGKTLLAEVLAKCLFNDKEVLVQFFMGTFSGDDAISRLIGPPIGCPRYEYGGQLTEPVLKKRHGVILFEDIEKAHPAVFSLLHRILVDGIVKDSLGQIVDFTNTVIIMNSTNVGSPYTVDADNDSLTKEYETLRQSASAIFGREFMDHVDDFIVFRPFDRCHLNQLVRLEFDRVQKRLAPKKISIEFTNAAVKLLVNLAYSPNCSARAMKRVIRKFVTHELAGCMINNEYKENDTILIDIEKTTDDDNDGGLSGGNGQLIRHMKFVLKKLGNAHLEE